MHSVWISLWSLTLLILISGQDSASGVNRNETRVEGCVKLLVVLPLFTKDPETNRCTRRNIKALVIKESVLKTLEELKRTVDPFLKVDVLNTCGDAWGSSLYAGVDDSVGMIGPIGANDIALSNLAEGGLEMAQIGFDVRADYVVNPNTLLYHDVFTVQMRYEPLVNSIIRLMEEFHWTYVSILTEESYAFQVLNDLLVREMTKKGFCIARQLMVHRRRADYDDETLRRLISYGRENSTVISLMTSWRLDQLLQDNLAKRFNWLSVSRMRRVSNNWEVVLVAEEVMTSSRADVILNEIENEHDVSIPDYEYALAGRQAIQAFYFALYNHLSEYGEKDEPICSRIQGLPNLQLRPIMPQLLKNISFTADGQSFSFDPKTNALNKNVQFTALKDGTWQKVGGYDGSELLVSDYMRQKFGIESVCSRECGPGYSRVFHAGQRCCWVCVLEN